MPEILSCGHIVAMASSLADIRLVEVTAHVGKLAGPKSMGAGSKHDVTRSA
jgi:hypothetical protein